MSRRWRSHVQSLALPVGSEKIECVFVEQRTENLQMISDPKKNRELVQTYIVFRERPREFVQYTMRGLVRV